MIVGHVSQVDTCSCSLFGYMGGLLASIGRMKAGNRLDCYTVGKETWQWNMNHFHLCI